MLSMKKFLLTTILALTTLFSNLNLNAADRPVTVPQHLQDISVTIVAGGSQGSGVLFTRTNELNQRVTLVWTAAHVIASQRSDREVIDPKGAKRTVVEFKDVQILKTIVEDGRTIGRLMIDAEVLKYSDADNGEDLALLRVRKKDYIVTTVVFDLKSGIPDIGTELFHVGSLLGSMGANSMTTGIYSQVGRLADKKVFDQTTVTAFPGSSGGGVFRRDGTYVGMLVRGAGETFNLTVPMRRIKDWTARNNIQWAVDPTLAMPVEADLAKIPVEDSGVK